jgi:hypothetical protein
MTTTSEGRPHRGSTAWTEGTAFVVGMLMVTLGAMQLLESIAALAGDSIFGKGDDIYGLSLRTWGWIHLVIAVIVLLTGLGIVANRSWGLVLGLCIGFFSAVASFAFLPYYPGWSLVLLALNIWVLWALIQELGTAD